MASVGYIALWIALLISVFAAVAFAREAKSDSPKLREMAKNGLIIVLGLVTISALILLYSIISHNFQLEYVYEYTSSSTAPFYLFSALWAGNAGAILLWAWVLGLLSALVILRKEKSRAHLIPYAGMVLAITEAFLLVLLVFLANPFKSTPVPVTEGLGPPLATQNIGMVLHPPALIGGYAGFAIPFAFAISSLMIGKTDGEWLTTTRKYTLLAWLLLGLGNIIGAWWAYVELGWGGYWAWDPVENASLMPWLVATAFIHSSVMQRRRGSFRIWNFILVAMTFCLVFFGAFLDRSSIPGSNHTFPDTGIMQPLFLIFIAAALIGSLALIYLRFSGSRETEGNEALVSRESTFLINNFLMVGGVLIILLGTVFPWISSLGGNTVVLDSSFYNKVNGPILLAIILLIGICTAVTWRRRSVQQILSSLLWPVTAGILIGILIFIFLTRNVPAAIGIAICAIVIFSILNEWAREASARHKSSGNNYLSSWWYLLQANGQRYGGYIVHISVVLIAVGVIGSSFYGVSKSATLNVGQSMKINQYSITYNSLSSSQTADSSTVAAKLSVYNSGSFIGTMVPEQNYQNSRNQAGSEVAIRSTLAEDLYIGLTNQTWPKSGDPVSLTVLVNPLVIWIWIGGGAFLLGGLITFWPARRTRLTGAAEDEVPEVKVKSTLVQSSTGVQKEAEEEIEKQILEKRRKQGVEKPGIVCPQCGFKNAPNARFCSQCGNTLTKGKKKNG